MEGSEANLLPSSKTSQSNAAYKDFNEYRADLKDERYKKDPDFRASVNKRLQLSKQKGTIKR